MAIDDNTSYELTGYQVKDLAQKIRAKADSSSLASVATSGLYSDLTGAPTIPTVYNGTLTIQQDGATLGTFSANQSTNETINITGGGSSATKFYVNTSFGNAFTPVYKDSNHTEAATSDEVRAAITNGGVTLVDNNNSEAYAADYYKFGSGFRLAFVWDTIARFTVEFGLGSSTTTVVKNRGFQEKLTAGNGINISAQNVISATGATVAPVTLRLNSPAAGQFTTDKSFDRLYSEDVVEVFVGTSRFGVIGYDEPSYIIYVCDGTNVYSLEYTSGSATTGAYTTTPLTVFTGATTQQAGSAGLVPAPTTSDINKYLSSDGSWASIADRSPVEFYWYNNDLYTDNMMDNQVDPSNVELLYRNRPLLIDNPSNTSFESVISINGGGTINAVVMNYSSSDMVVVQYRYDYGNAVWTRSETNVSYTAGSNITISNGTISATDTTYSNFTGATSSVAGAAGLVPAPAAGDQEKVLHGDGTWKDTTAKLVEMSYGESGAWAKFISAYNAGSIVYCRASSNSNPATGSQTRKAFMAYVNNATSPTSVEFQYVRSQSSKTDSQQTDQVFVYTLTNTSGGTWSVASRNMAPKINVDGPITKTFTTGANATVTIGANAMTGATSDAAGTAGIVPAPAAGDDTKFLSGDGTWKAVGGGGGGKTLLYYRTGTSSQIGIYTESSYTNKLTGQQVLDYLTGGSVEIVGPTSGGKTPRYDNIFYSTSAFGSFLVVFANDEGDITLTYSNLSQSAPTISYKRYKKGFDAQSYSTSEQNTYTTWIDGKTIYRKVLQQTMPADTTWQTVATITGMDSLVKLSGSYHRTDGVWTECPRSTLLTYINSSSSLQIKDTEGIGGTAYIVVEYTKSS